MRVVAVDGIPERKPMGRKHRLYALLDEFVEMGVKFGKVETDDIHDYPNSAAAYANLLNSARCGGFHIAVIRRGNDIYLMRTDM